jgi:geranylgeranyl pyrophosphate synthase
VILAEAVMKICAGEVRQQSIRYRYSTTVDEYMQRIEAKTATLLAASCDIGALLGGLSQKDRSALRGYGRALGLAFQIADDVLDYIGTVGEVGKPIGHDVIDGFATLPWMLSSVAIEDGRRLSESEARRVIDEVRKSDGPTRALEEAKKHARAAREHLRTITRSDATDALASLTDYVVTRKL